MAAADDSSGECPRLPFDVDRHLRYFQRCFRTLLPCPYTSNDSTRMALGFFVIAGLDLLSPRRGGSGPVHAATLATEAAAAAAAVPRPPARPDPLTRDDRRRLRDWILSCQHTHGGFCGSTTHTLPSHEYDGYDFESSRSVPGNPGAANIAATAFALILLALVADPSSPESAFSGVDRFATLRWLRRLQRPDGSFGEVLVEMAGGTTRTATATTIAGGRDMRYCYLAAIVRWILRGDVQQGQPGWVEDIDVEALTRHIHNGQTYDGGFGESSMHESHAGYAYCAIGALALLQRPAEGAAVAPGRRENEKDAGIDPTSLARFLASRQLLYQDSGGEDASDDGDAENENFPQPSILSRESVASQSGGLVGFNGRLNKVADTCYCWWVPGTVAVLRDLRGGEADVPLAREPARRFLMEKTQHMIGGFSKNPGGPPDLYHAYFGLAALAVMGEQALKELDVTLCVSVDTIKKIEAGRRGLLSVNTARPEMDNSSGTEGDYDAIARMGEALAGADAHTLFDLSGVEEEDDGRRLEQILTKRLARI